MKIRTKIYTFIVFLTAYMVIPFNVWAAEITAVDFNGNIIGQVIPTGMVINASGQNIGTITADSLILNGQGEVIGGAVPQGIAIGNDNRFLGKIFNDGIVRAVSGKELGKALPSGLVVDSSSSVIGSVLYPGIVYSASGETVGRVNGAGLYTNLEGQEIGFVSANGYAYKRSGEEYVLDGRLMASKMIVSLTGQFIGSVAPTGNVIDFEGKSIGNIHANGYAYDQNGNIIGGIVQTGYAFNLVGNYIGLVTFNGEVVRNDMVIGHYRPDGNIVDENNEIIGFAVSISATAGDRNGRYIGRIFPDGTISNGAGVIGRIGAKKYVYDQENKKIGEIIETGPVFDTQAQLIGQAIKNGSVISLRGSMIGTMRGQYAYDTNGMLVGGTTKDLLAYDANNNALGVANIDTSIKVGTEAQKVSPFGYLFNADGKVVGGSFAMAPAYSLEGLLYSYVAPNGKLYRGVSDVKLTQTGILAGKDGYIGSLIDSLYNLSFTGYSLGMPTESNVLVNEKGEISYKIIPGHYVVSSPQRLTSDMTPIKGFSGQKMIALNIGGDLLGYTDSEGKLFNLSGQEAGHVVANEYVVDNNQVVIGRLIPFTTVINDKCSPIGVVNGHGDVVNNRGVIVGRLLPNGQAISDVGSYIGYAVFNHGLTDFDGKFVGTINSGRGITYDGKSLGCIDRRGVIKDAENHTLYGVIENESVIGFNNEILGHILANGNVIGHQNQIIGYVQPDGNVVSKSKKALGQIMKYHVAYGIDNHFLGMVQNDGKVYNQAGDFVGQVLFDGSVQKDDMQVGYALYDFYVYDEDFTTYGYLTKDGTVLSMAGSKLGSLDRGFVLDRKKQVVARGNRDYIVRDKNDDVVGELQLDGNVINNDGQNVGYLAEAGIIRNSEGDEIAVATQYQYYTVRQEEAETQPKPETPRERDWSDQRKVEIQDNEDATSKVQESGSGYKKQKFSNKIVGIALNPDGDIIGDIYEDDSVRDKDGNILGYRTPDGMIVDVNYNPIGIEEIQNASSSEMFIPENAFGKGNAYGIGDSPTNLGPGGGYGQGERYDPVKMRVLTQRQAQRRQNIQYGVVATSNIKPSSFTGYEEDGWGTSRQISSWRVDMSEMILEDKPIPAVLARSVYGSDSGGFSDGVPITAIVERNVFSEEGRNIIIPAGSRVIGSLGGEVGTGGTSGGAIKMQIEWKRLIRPDGSQWQFAAQTADAQGRMGALAYLDEQLLKKYTMPIVASGVENAIAYMMASGSTSTSNNGSSTEDARAQAAADARQNFQDQINKIVEEIMDKKSKIQPVTYMPAGTRIIIYPGQDLWLNSIDRDQKRDEENSGGPDTGGLTANEKPGGGSRSHGDNVSYSGNYQENVKPAQPNKQRPGNRSSGGYIAPNNPQQSSAPASTNSTDGSGNGNNEVPDFI
ncbi:MAG: TrbI/VirB10 family protein [Alphaproteobacteria bacterium]|nr:TrbI/VirB10 family protein [Alphaproteobacteria bacterium]